MENKMSIQEGKLYKAAPSVTRAALKFLENTFGGDAQLIKKEYKDKIIVQKDVGGLFYWKNAQEILFPKTEVKKEETSPKKTKRVYANSSSCGSPCEVVWNIASEMKGAKRKEVLAACEEAGVTFYTARTQYQKYQEALRGDVK